MLNQSGIPKTRMNWIAKKDNQEINAWKKGKHIKRNPRMEENRLKTENKNCSAHKMLMVFIALVLIWGN